MKNLILLFFVVLLLGATQSLTQDKNESLEKGMFFSSQEEAEEAYASGDFRYYQPDPKNLKDHPPFLAKGLPSAYVALEVVRENSGESPSWVILPEGIPAVFNYYGIPIEDGRCWNQIKKAFPLSKKRKGDTGLNGKDGRDGQQGPQGIAGLNGRDGKDGKDAILPTIESSWLERNWGYGGALLFAIGGYFLLSQHDDVVQQPQTPPPSGGGNSDGDALPPSPRTVPMFSLGIRIGI